MLVWYCVMCVVMCDEWCGEGCWDVGMLMEVNDGGWCVDM